MFLTGLCSAFQKYMPGAGQRLGQRPTWDKMRATLMWGGLNAMTNAYRKRLHEDLKPKRTRRQREQQALFSYAMRLRAKRQPVAEMELRKDGM